MVRLQIFKIEGYQAGRTHPDCLICLTLFVVKSTEKGKMDCPRVHDGRKEVKTLEARLSGSNPCSFTTAESPGQVTSSVNTSFFSSVNWGQQQYKLHQVAVRTQWKQ